MSNLTKVVEKIKELISAGKHGEAIYVIESINLKRISESCPAKTSGDLFLIAGMAYYNNGDIRKAKELVAKYESNINRYDNSLDYIRLKYKLLIVENKIDETLKMLETALEIVNLEKDFYEIIYYLGNAHFWKGDYLKTNKYLQRCCHFFLDNSDYYKLAQSQYMLGYTAFQRSFFDQAENHFNRVIETLNKFGIENSKERTLFAKTHKLISILKYRIGDYNASEENLILAKKYFESCSNRFSILLCQITQARIFLFKDEHDKALESLSSAYNESIESNLSRVRAVAGEFLGEVHYKLGNFEKALEYLNDALEIALKSAKYGDSAVEVYRRLGDVYIELNEIEKAEDMLSEALKRCEYLEDRYELGAVYRAMGLVAVRKDDIDLARSLFNEAVTTLKLIKESFELAKTYITAAREYDKWSKRPGVRKDFAAELLEDARAFAVEAAHLYSKLDLPDREKECKEFIDNLDSGMVYHKRYSGKALNFNRDWLYSDILVARSRPMIETITRIKQIAPSDISVLITGETGTGKEVVSRLIHKMSKRADCPFVAVNCASVPGTVFESEMFGHKKGAFTGAIRDKKGILEEADGGTLLLDEISELSDHQQATLLRALQERRVRRVGSAEERPIDVRLICASNQPVDVLLESGQLRRDFYYRISAEVINLKPLRERKEDIEALFPYYLDRFGNSFHIETGVMELMNSYHWPGNVRELINVVQVLSVLGGNRGRVCVRDLPASIRSFTDSSEINTRGGLRSGMDLKLGKDPARRAIETAIERNKGNKSAAARELGISRSTLYRKFEELNPSG